MKLVMHLTGHYISLNQEMPVVRDARSTRSVPVIVPVEPIEISVQAESVRNGKPPLIV